MLMAAQTTPPIPSRYGAALYLSSTGGPMRTRKGRTHPDDLRVDDIGALANSEPYRPDH
jgi:hypothetical protein